MVLRLVACYGITMKYSEALLAIATNPEFAEVMNTITEEYGTDVTIQRIKEDTLLIFQMIRSISGDGPTDPLLKGFDAATADIFKKQWNDVLERFGQPTAPA